MDQGRRSTGIDGLDDILDGGMRAGQNTLLRGPPGSGKTIVGLHFLSAGVDAGETSLFVNLGEPSEYVRRTAESFGLRADEIRFHDLAPSEEGFSPSESYSIFESASVEAPELITELRETIDAVDPDRVLLDPITEFRYLTADQHQFRTRILSFLEYLRAREATVILTSQAADTLPDDDLQFLVDSVVSLDIGADSRTVQVTKFRGSSFTRGPHAYEIDGDGVTVWPRLLPDADAPDADTPDPITGSLSSGVPELDQLLDGGLANGTITFLSGPTGVGKTTTGLQFLKEAAAQGKSGVMFQFEESSRTMLERAEAINIPIQGLIDRGDLRIVQIDPESHTVDEFGALVRSAVADDGVEVVMIDGMQGFKRNLRGFNEEPAAALLRIGRYLRALGITGIITNEVHTITGDFQVTEEGTSNLADNIVFIRHVEYQGEVRKVIGALKMRTSDFERTLRELDITEYGISVGEPLSHLTGILTGTPEWTRADPSPVERTRSNRARSERVPVERARPDGARAEPTRTGGSQADTPRPGRDQGERARPDQSQPDRTDDPNGD